MSDRVLYIIVAIIAIIFIGVVVYFLSRPQSQDPKEKDGLVNIGGGSPGPVNTGGGSQTVTIIGKTAYAKRDGVVIYRNKNSDGVTMYPLSLKYKTAKKDEWIGDVGSISSSGAIAYIIGYPERHVIISEIYIK